LPIAAEELLAVRPDAKYVLYDSGAHAPHWENAEQFNQELATFIDLTPIEFENAAVKDDKPDR
jgi:pimeloyl-ACP methyl ester carboxylesterase